MRLNELLLVLVAAADHHRLVWWLMRPMAALLAVPIGLIIGGGRHARSTASGGARLISFPQTLPGHWHPFAFNPAMRHQHLGVGAFDVLDAVGSGGPMRVRLGQREFST